MDEDFIVTTRFEREGDLGIHFVELPDYKDGRLLVQRVDPHGVAADFPEIGANSNILLKINHYKVN